MTTRITEYKHELSGNWSISGVVKQLDSLTGILKKLDPNKNKKLHVDCTRIKSIDMSGLQLIRVWRECARIRGVESRLINIPDHMYKTIQSVGLGRSFSDCIQDAV